MLGQGHFFLLFFSYVCIYAFFNPPLFEQTSIFMQITPAKQFKAIFNTVYVVEA